MGTDFDCAVSNFIDTIDNGWWDDEVLEDIKWIASQEGITPKMVLWRVEAQVGNRLHQTAMKLAKMLEA